MSMLYMYTLKGDISLDPLSNSFSEFLTRQIRKLVLEIHLTLG